MNWLGNNWRTTRRRPTETKLATEGCHSIFSEEITHTPNVHCLKNDSDLWVRSKRIIFALLIVSSNLATVASTRAIKMISSHNEMSIVFPYVLLSV